MTFADKIKGLFAEKDDERDYQRLRGCGGEFFEAICRTKDGKVVTAGYRTGVIRSAAGVHIIEVLEVMNVEDPRERDITVGQLVLSGTGWD